MKFYADNKVNFNELFHHRKENHIPCKKSYGLNDIICDLLRFAARHLSIGGRLVFWMPVCRERLDLIYSCSTKLHWISSM